MNFYRTAAGALATLATLAPLTATAQKGQDGDLTYVPVAASGVSGDEFEFASIWSVAEFPRGGVSINFTGTSISLFDLRGRLVRQYGRTGAGPGEFRGAVAHGWLGDTLWVNDIALRRTTFFDTNQQVIRTTVWPKAFTASPGDSKNLRSPSVVMNRGHLDDGSSLYSVFIDPASAVSRGFPIGSREAVVRGSASGVVLAHIAAIGEGSGSDCQQLWSAGNNLKGGFPIPFCSGILAAVSPSGIRHAVLHQGGNLPPGELRLVVRNERGVQIYESRVRTERIPISNQVQDETRDRLKRSLGPQASPAAREAAAKVAIPKVYPAANRILVADDGTVWIERFDRYGAKVYASLAPASHRGLASVSVPAGLEVKVLGKRDVWGIVLDDTDVPSVVRLTVK